MHLMPDILKEHINELLDEMIIAAQTELREQGHVASGNLVSSIEAKAIFGGPLTVVRVWAEAYGVALEHKIPASAFSWPPGREQIEGLTRWAAYVKPSLTYRQRRSFAYAVARAHSRHGMPTPGSYAFSKNGRRTGWVEKSLVEPAAERVEAFAGKVIEKIYNETLLTAQNRQA